MNTSHVHADRITKNLPTSPSQPPSTAPTLPLQIVRPIFSPTCHYNPPSFPFRKTHWICLGFKSLGEAEKVRFKTLSPHRFCFRWLCFLWFHLFLLSFPVSIATDFLYFCVVRFSRVWFWVLRVNQVCLPLICVYFYWRFLGYSYFHV